MSDIIDSIRAAIRQSKREGDFPDLTLAFRAMDTNRDGQISFSEFAAPSFMNQHCSNARYNPGGYNVCLATANPAMRDAADYTTSMHADLSKALGEYAEYRRGHGVPGRLLLGLGGVQLGGLNRLLRNEGLPTFEPQVLQQAVDYMEPRLNQYQAGSGRFPLPRATSR